jgi:hypothetical protein
VTGVTTRSASSSWQLVEDPNWDNNAGGCGFLFQTTWANIQSCHPATFITDVYMIADPYGHTHWIDELNTDGRVFTTAAGNGR